MSIVAHIVLILLSFMCLFFFAILLGGSGWDAVGAGAAGIGMVLILYLGRKIGLNDFFQLLLASAVIAVVAYLAAKNPYQTIQMDIVIIAAIMPIVPVPQYASTTVSFPVRSASSIVFS